MEIQLSFVMDSQRDIRTVVILLQVVPKRIMMSQKRRLQINSCL